MNSYCEADDAPMGASLLLTASSPLVEVGDLGDHRLFSRLFPVDRMVDVDDLPVDDGSKHQRGRSSDSSNDGSDSGQIHD